MRSWRCLLDLPDDAVHADVPEQAAAWSDLDLCGRYSLGPGLLTDPQPRMLGAPEVAVRRGHLVIRGQIPVPAVHRGLRLYPDGDDPYAFALSFPGSGRAPPRSCSAAAPQVRSRPCTRECVPAGRRELVTARDGSGPATSGQQAMCAGDPAIPGGRAIGLPLMLAPAGSVQRREPCGEVP